MYLTDTFIISAGVWSEQTCVVTLQPWLQGNQTMCHESQSTEKIRQSVRCKEQLAQFSPVCQVLRFRFTTLTVLRTALFWAEISDVVSGICWSHSPKFSDCYWYPCRLLFPTSFQLPLSVLGISPALRVSFPLMLLSVCI